MSGKMEKARRKKGGDVLKEMVALVVFILNSSFLNEKTNCLTEEVY